MRTVANTVGLTGAGEEVPAAEQVAGSRSQQILGTTKSTKAKIPDGGKKKKKSL